MTRGSTSHAPARFLSPSPHKFEPMIKKASLNKLIRSIPKRIKKETNPHKKYQLQEMLKDFKFLKEQL